MDERDRHLLDCCGSLLTNFWEESSLTEKELKLVDYAIKILLHVRFPENEHHQEQVKELNLESIE